MTSSTAPPLTQLVPQLMGLLHRKVSGDTLTIMHEANLTMPQMVALHVLQHGGPQTINGLAETLHLSTSAASHLVDRLVERGLVARNEDPEDRRQKRVELAGPGQQLLGRLMAAQAQEIERLAARLEPDVRVAVEDLLLQTIQHLQKSL